MKTSRSFLLIMIILFLNAPAFSAGKRTSADDEEKIKFLSIGIYGAGNIPLSNSWTSDISWKHKDSLYSDSLMTINYELKGKFGFGGGIESSFFVFNRLKYSLSIRFAASAHLLQQTFPDNTVLHTNILSFSLGGQYDYMNKLFVYASMSVRTVLNPNYLGAVSGFTEFNTTSTGLSLGLKYRTKIGIYFGTNLEASFDSNGSTFEYEYTSTIANSSTLLSKVTSYNWANIQFVLGYDLQLSRKNKQSEKKRNERDRNPH
jgi:hypothetical protein